MNITLTEFGERVSGQIVVRMPTNGQRMMLYKNANIDFFKLSSEIAANDETQNSSMMSNLIMSIMDEVGVYCEKIDIEVGGEKINSFEQISTRSDLVGIQIQIASAVLLGSQSVLNKKKKRSARR